MEWKKETIMGTLRKMEMGDEKVFPISNRSYLLNLTSYRLKEKEPGRKWSIVSDVKKGIVTVICKK